MPATMESQGTERYLEFEERRYTVRCLGCKDSKTPPPENRAQYEWKFALEGTADPETGAEIVIEKTWCSQIWNDGAGTESHLVLFARALCGPSITREEFEALDFPDLIGLRGGVIVKLNAKGYPTVDKTTFKPLTKSATPATGPRPGPRRPTVSATRTEDQAAEILLLGRASEPAMSDAEIDAWISGTYPGKTLATISIEEAANLIKEFGLPF